MKIFDAGDLHFFDLTAEDADEALLRKSYFKKSLGLHPDKGGSKEAFQDLVYLYENLMQVCQQSFLKSQCQSVPTLKCRG